MCGTCGCGDDAVLTLHPGEHAHDGHDDGHTVVLQQKVLAKNDDLARRNRDWLAEGAVFLGNLISSPGAGKTTRLERTSARTSSGLNKRDLPLGPAGRRIASRT